MNKFLVKKVVRAEELNVHIINMIHKAKEVNDQQVINKIHQTEMTHSLTKRRITRDPVRDPQVIEGTVREPKK